MLNENKEYWLCISEKVYYRIMDTQALLYNTETGEYMRTDNPEIIKLLQLLYKKDDLGTIRCNARTLANSPYKEFIYEFCAKQLGELIELSQAPERPVRLMPILNLQHDIDRLNNAPEFNIGENIPKHEMQTVMCTLQHLLPTMSVLYEECRKANSGVGFYHSKKTIISNSV